MKNTLVRLILFLITTTAFAQADMVKVVNNENGMKLVVNGEDFMIN